MDDLAEASIWTERLVLRPLRVTDATEMVGVLGDPALHEFIGGRPDGLEELRRRYAAVVGVPWQGRGYAAEAARALVGWLVEAGGERIWRRHPGGGE